MFSSRLDLLWFCGVSIYASFVAAASSKRGPPLPSSHLSLSSFNWTLSNANRSIILSTPFLNQPHLALIDAGIIDEPNIGLNEGTVRWVGEEEAWTWETTFQIGADPHWTGVDRFYLAFNGLDTFCDIELGGHRIGSTDNAFRSWVFDVTEAVLAARSHSSISLSLRFASAAAITSRLAHEPGNIWFPGRESKHAPTLELYEYNYRNWARKQQSDFGWDWGPAYLPCGPLQPAYLIGLSGEKEETKKSALSLSQNIPDFTPRPGERTTRISLQPFESGPSSTTGQGISAHLEQEKNQLTLQRRREKPRPNQLNTPPASFWIHRTVIDIHKKGQRNNLHPDQNEPWILNVTLPITSARSLHDTSLTLSAVLVGTSVRLEPKTLSITKPANYINLGPDYFLTAQYTIDHQSVELWYPATLGNPKLYDLELTLDFNDQEKNTSQLTWYERVGFRTIVVDQSRYSAQEVSQGITPGTRFTFVINGKPFYVQGSSMIPIDNFAARTNSSTIRWLIQSALLAHQNVVRIWGGGAYETDEFYDICDELGILAWSESVFACGAYPISPRSFLDNIRAEVAENIARLNRHPSTALWAGNNEGEGYLIAANRSWSNGSIYFNQYDYLYNHVIRDVVLNNTRSISYIPSSTTQGYFTLDPYVSRYYNSTPGEIYGDQELYNYDTSVSFNTKTYPVARFVNEFGFHSMPSIYTWERVLDSPEDYAFNSSVIRAHNKHNPAGTLQYPWPADDGQMQLTTGVTQYYPTPNITGNHRTLLAQWAYSTQVFQAAFMAAQIAYYRLGASRGEKNMGALYWQLNDIWEGISWSSVEYTGRWKVFHYVAERVQDHVIISPVHDYGKKTLDIYVTSDLWHEIEGTAQWTWYDFAGRKLSKNVADFKVGPISSTRLDGSVEISTMVPKGQPLNDAWLHLNLTSKDGKYSNEQFFYPLALKDCRLRPTKVVSRPIGRNQVSVEVSEGGVAAWVSVEHPPGVRGYFKDIHTNKPSNAFFLRPGEKRQLEFISTGSDDESLQDLESKMFVRTMWDNQHHSN